MTPKQLLRNRHKKAMLELNKTAVPIIEKQGLKKVCIQVAEILGVSFQTVVNYIYGRSKDGYLCEAITEQFKKLQ